MKRSFTLVELSVAASLLATALAILLTPVRSIRQQDRLAACLANLRAIGAASLAYAADDPSEFLIPVPDFSVLPGGAGTFEWGGKAGRGEPTQSGHPASSVFGTAAWRGPAHRPLNRILYRGEITDWNPVNGSAQPGPGEINYLNDANLDLDAYRCPADSGYAGGGFYFRGVRHLDLPETPFVTSGLSGYDHYGNSYAANTFTVGNGGSLWSNSPYFVPLSRIPHPGRTLAYQEVPSRCVWLWGDWDGSGCEFTQREQMCVGNDAAIPGWHERNFNFNVTFVDGHAASVEMRGCMRPSPNLGAVNYGGLCGDGYDSCMCITVRGPGWSLDILPADRVRTPWSTRSAPVEQDQARARSLAELHHATGVRN